MKEVNDEKVHEFGVVLFEKSNAKHMLDAPTGRVGAKGKAIRIYLILLGMALFSWLIYSFINMATDPEEGIVNSIFSHFASFFVLLVAELILFLSAFNGWGKFTRFALKHNLTSRNGIDGAQTRKLENELREVDANQEHENAVRVYNGFVIVVNDGKETLIHNTEIQRVKCVPTANGYILTFELYDDKPLIANIPLAIADLPLIKKHFDNFEYVPTSRGKEYLKKKLPMVAFMLVPILIGAALIVVRSLVLPDMPLIIGVMFLSIGTLLMLTQFSDVAVIGNGLIPICTGLLFLGLPIAIALTVADLAEGVTVVSMLSYFSPLHAGLSIFLGIGPMMIIAGVNGLIDCLRL